MLGFVWLGSSSDDPRNSYAFKGRSNDYYALLAHGLEHGHLYLDTPVDPRLLSSDPEVHSKASWLLDVSLYHGRYYLYFGVVPAALLFLPYHLLTGSDVSGNAVTLVLVALGFLVYLRIFSEAKKRYFPSLGAAQELASVILLGLAAGTPVLVVAGGVYETAIAAGYFCHALTWLGLFQAWHHREKSGRWICLASVATGLAVGCRPHYVFALPAVAIAAAFLVRRGGNLRILSLAAVLPAGAIGLCLAAYNYLRFGSPFEFGIHYCLSDMIGAGFPLYRASFFWSNLKWYYLRPPALALYFPYVFPMNATVRPQGYYGFETIQGQLAVTLLAALSLVGFLLWGRRRPEAKQLLALPALTFALMYLGLGFFGARANRYVVDFQGALILLVALAAGFSAEGKAAAPSCSGRLWRTGFVVLALLASLSNLLTSFQLVGRFENTRPKSWAFLSRIGNTPSVILERLGLIRYGPVRFRFRLPPFDGKPVARPLLTSGLPNATDLVYVTQHGANRVEIAVTHSGYGSLRSSLVVLEPGTEHVLEVDLGSLYPPRGHPWFGARSEEDIEALKTSALVTLDGTVLLHGRLRFYDAPPGYLFLGENPGGNDPPFRGKITHFERLAARPPGDPKDKVFESGIWRMNLTFPFQKPDVGQPILGSGTSGHGNLLFVETHRGHTVRFGIDEWGLGVLSSSDLPIIGDGPHLLEIFVGGQVARAKFPAEWDLDPSALGSLSSIVRLWLDGRPIWTTEITINQGSYDFVSLGTNPQGFSSTPSTFAGTLESITSTPQEIHAFLLKNLPKAISRRDVLKFRVIFPPPNPDEPALPLLGAGVTGDGNLILAKADSTSSYRIEMDDWAHGTLAGKSITMAPGEHELVFILGPLLPDRKGSLASSNALDLSALRNRILVFVDGARAGDFVVQHHLNRVGEVTPGSNPQGFSTAAATYRGALFEQDIVKDPEVADLLARALGP